MIEKNDLKPCPFCNSRHLDVDISRMGFAWIVCKTCHANGPEGVGIGGAIANWNNRVSVQKSMSREKEDE